MKKPIAFLIAIIYFCISSGMVMNVHYCMGKISSVKLDLLAKNLCGCKTEKSKGCCKTEHQYLKVTDTYKVSYADFSFNLPVKEISSSYQIFTQPVFGADDMFAFANHSPPVIDHQDTYLLNCVFRI